MFNDDTAPGDHVAVLPRPPRPDEPERILLAIGDSRLRPLLVDLLTAEGYRILEASNDAQAFDFALNRRLSLAVLDLSDFGGAALLPRLRENTSTLPLLALAPDNTARHRIDSLLQGADDCVGQPFDPEELLARIRALLRRCNAPAAPSRIELGEIIVDLERMIAHRGPELIRLSRTECSILDLLAKNRGQPVSRTRMLDVVWGYAYLPNTRTLDTHIWRLRRKLGDAGDHPRWIVNVAGIGYQLQAR